jgi:selenocysteine lyase/cysteine desulfurase
MADSHKITYLDNAATSWPKPPYMLAAMTDFNLNIGANPGRSGHRLSVQAARVVYAARQQLADLFNAPDALRIVFSANITAAINNGRQQWYPSRSMGWIMVS